MPQRDIEFLADLADNLYEARDILDRDGYLLSVIKVNELIASVEGVLEEFILR